MSCEKRREQILLLAAGALDAEERDELRAHMDGGCPRCAGSLVEAEAVLAHVPLMLDSVEPPPEVGQRLMQRIAAEADARPDRAADVDEEDVPRLWAGWLRPVLAAAAVGVLTFFLISVPMERRRIKMERMIDSQTVEIQQHKTQIRRLENTAAGQALRVQILKAPSLATFTLDPTDTQPDARARVFWDRRRARWLFDATGLDPTAPDRTYQLWFITTDDQKVSAGTFDVKKTGYGELVATVPADIGTIAVAAVTDEPAGGSPQPTGQIHLVGKVREASET